MNNSKRGNKKGKAAVITSEQYKENLMDEKSTSLKKKTVRRKSVGKKSKPEVPNISSTSLSKENNKGEKRKKLSTDKPVKRRKPLTDMNGQIPANVAEPATEQSVQALNGDLVPLQNYNIIW